MEVAHRVLRELRPRRHPSLISKLRSALRSVVMIVADGEDWERSHKAIAPYFTPAYTREHYLPAIADIAEETFSALRSRIHASGEEAVAIDVEACMRLITARVMGLVLFGSVLTAEDAEFVQATLDKAMRPPSGWPLSQLNLWLGAAFHIMGRGAYQPMLFPNGQRRALDALLAWITVRLQSSDARGIPAPGAPVLAALQKRYASVKGGVRTKMIAAEYAMLFIAGIETTAAALTFALSAVSHHPTVLGKLVREVRAADQGAALPFPLSRFPYAYQVFQETVRLNSIVPTMLRMASQGEEIDGVPIPARATYRIMMARFHRNLRVWDRPGVFDPDRFAAPLSPAQRASYMPFGSGPNICLGRDIAAVQAVVTLVVCFRHLDILPGSVSTIVRKDTTRSAIDTIRPSTVTALLRARPPGLL